MTGERPDDAQRPEDTAGTGDGTDGLEARRASDADAPFHGLRSAADIFGAPRSAEEWPSRRERREAIKAAQETGAPLPEPFTAPTEEDHPADAESAPAGGAVRDEEAARDEAADDADADATQAISMPEELRAPSQHAHPSSIQLPTAQTNRDARAAEARALDEERRRTDPTGAGRDDVDWLGRATGTGTGAVTVGEPMARQPLGVEDALPSADEPPSFTDLLRVQSSPDDGAPGPDRPFDWAVRDDETGEVPTALTSDAYDTTAFGTAAFDTGALATGSWSLADEAEAEDEVVTGEVPAAGPGGSAAAALGAAGAAAAGGAAAAPTGAEPDVPTTRLSVPDAATGLPVEPSRPSTPAEPERTSAPAEPESAPAEPESAPAEPAASAESAPGGPASAAEPAASAPTRWSLSDDAEETPTVAFEPPRSATATPWWAEPDDAVPPTAAPPLVEPAPESYPAHLPPAVGQDFDGLLSDPDPRPDSGPAATAGPAAGPLRPEDIDQSEWTDRETSDTSAIKDLFGTAAVDQLGTTGYDPHDTGTAMMPAVRSSPSAAPAARAPETPPPSQQGIINQQFAKLQGEGTRGKQLLIGGAVVLIVVLLVLVFLFAKWIMGNTVADHLVPPTASPTAAAQSAAPSSTPSAEAEQAQTPATALQFATTPAAPGEHEWTDLAGGECLSPFTNAWAQTFTVVDCSTPHAAQLTARLPVQADAYPGADALSAQAAEQCQTSAALDTAAAASVGDVQVQGAYAPDESTWQQGDRFISCFVTRSSGQELTGSLAPTA
ncbi:septum formation family protein [Curtobacterium sp. 1P10AnD]|uniref:septum formation family protein n=1 Tax=Curtobacterium sp. 1P10AnD TaxID=3132283 RepID=UPI0039A293E1